MPYSVEWEENGIHIVYSGSITAPEIRESQYWTGDERFDNLEYLWADFSQVESFDLTPQEVKEFAYTDMASARSNPDIRFAITASNKFIKEMANLYSKYAESSPWQIGIFESIEDTKKWLNTE